MSYSKILLLLSLCAPLTSICSQPKSRLDPLQLCYVAKKVTQTASLEMMKKIEDENNCLREQVNILKKEFVHLKDENSSLKEHSEEQRALIALYDGQEDDWVKEDM